MSAEKTDVEKQTKEHGTALSGMALSVGFAAVLLVGLIAYLSMSGNEPGDDTPVAASATESGSADN